MILPKVELQDVCDMALNFSGLNHVYMYDNKLLGAHYSSVTLNYFGLDNETNFLENCKKMPDDWYYRNKTIVYKYNSNGHRCCEINELDFNNYILFCGDSHTNGTGLELETTYAYLTAKQLNIPYYNLGIEGSGLDYLFYNLNIWLSIFPPPKFIFSYYTDPSRFLLHNKQLNDEKRYAMCGTWVHDRNILNVLTQGDEIGYFNTQHELQENALLCRIDKLNIPFYKFQLMPQDTIYKKLELLKWEDKARDRRHLGITHHKVIADCLVDQYTTKYSNATVHSTIRGQN